MTMQLNIPDNDYSPFSSPFTVLPGEDGHPDNTPDCDSDQWEAEPAHHTFLSDAQRAVEMRHYNNARSLLTGALSHYEESGVRDSAFLLCCMNLASEIDRAQWGRIR